MTVMAVRRDTGQGSGELAEGGTGRRARRRLVQREPAQHGRIHGPGVVRNEHGAGDPAVAFEGIAQLSLRLRAHG